MHFMAPALHINKQYSECALKLAEQIRDKEDLLAGCATFSDFDFKEEKVARVTGLEPATSGVTGRHSNQLSYTRAVLHVLK